MEPELKHLAETDPLTGICNRRLFLERAEIEFRHARQDGRPLAVLMVDVDRFKRINDTYGHPFGDQVLKTVSDTCQQTLRDTGVLGRFGGEEFAIILPNTYMDTAQLIAECLRQAVEVLAVDYQGQTTTITVSIGATEQRDEDALNDMIKRANTALYRAKKGGRNQVQFA